MDSNRADCRGGAVSAMVAVLCGRCRRWMARVFASRICNMKLRLSATFGEYRTYARGSLADIGRSARVRDGAGPAVADGFVEASKRADSFRRLWGLRR